MALVRFAEVFEFDVLELDPEVVADERPARQRGDVAEHRFAAVAEAGGFDGADFDEAAELVDDEHLQRFGFDVFRDDEQRPAAAGDLLEQREELADVAELFLVNQDVRLLGFPLHVGRVDHEVGRHVALVELHPFDELEDRVGGFAFFDGDDAVLADLAERLGHQLADLRIVVRRDRCHLRHLFLLGEALGQRPLQEFDGLVDGLLDAFLDAHRVGPGGDVPQAFLVDGQGEHGRGGGAVAGGVGGLLGDRVHEFGAHVFKRVGEFDFFRNRDAVLRDGWPAERFVDDDVPPGWPEGDADGLRQLFRAL